MRGGIPLFRFRGIRVFLHWTFLLLPAYIAFTGFAEGSTGHDVLIDIGLVLIVFGCVVLHEFGHALTAQRFGVNTRDITLLPIGGVASLERMPEDPKQEFWITVAGPLVNVAIAAIAFALLAIGGLAELTTAQLTDISSWTSVLTFLCSVNIGLFLFNLIPAFPMDGGRILRSLLSMRLPREKATRIATLIGRVLAVGFVGYGLYSSAPFLAIIGVFIFLAAGAENRVVDQAANARSLRVGQRMRKDSIQLPADATVQTAWNAITLIDQQVVLVMQDGLYRGMVLKDDLRNELSNGRGTGSISVLARHVPSTAPEESALNALGEMVHNGLSAMRVVNNGAFEGVVLRADLERALGQWAPR